MKIGQFAEYRIIEKIPRFMKFRLYGTSTSNAFVQFLPQYVIFVVIIAENMYRVFEISALPVFLKPSTYVRYDTLFYRFDL